LIKNSQPFGKKFQKTAGGVFFTHTVYILTAVPQSEWRRPVGRPYTSWMATLKKDLARHNLTFEDAIELALDKPLWRLLAASGATH